MTFRFNHIVITLYCNQGVKSILKCVSRMLLFPFVQIVISESLILTMPSEKELRFVKHLNRRLQRKLNNAISTTKLIITAVGILMPRGLNHEYILSFMLFLFLVIVLIVGLKTFCDMPYQISYSN